MIDYRQTRLNMVEGQLRTNKVTDIALLEAFLDVARERFVPESLRGIAYVDEDIPLGGGRYLMEPMVLARLLQAGTILPTDRVLNIGATTGYAACLLSRLAKSVVAIEADPRLAGEARARLAELARENVRLLEGSLTAGDPGRGPYDVILIEGAVAAVPEAIAAQLVEGGRLLTVLKAEAGMGHAALMTRVEGRLSHRPAFDAGTPLLPGFGRAPSFVF